MSFCNTIIEKLKAKTPKAWKQIQVEAIAFGTSCTAVWVINSTLGLGLDAGQIEFLKYAICASAFIAGRSQFKVDEPNQGYSSGGYTDSESNKRLEQRNG